MFVILMFARKWVGWYRLLRYRKAFSLPLHSMWPVSSTWLTG